MVTIGFDYFVRGEPLDYVSGSSSTTGFDYFNRAEPFRALITVEVVSGGFPDPSNLSPISRSVRSFAHAARYNVSV